MKNLLLVLLWLFVLWAWWYLIDGNNSTSSDWKSINWQWVEQENVNDSNKEWTVLKKISLIQAWFPTASQIWDYYAKFEFAEKNWIILEVTPWSDQLNSIQLVQAGKFDIWTASAEKVMIANEKWANLVIIWVVNAESPTCFLAKKEKNIKTPQDFYNHKIWTLEWASTHLIYKALLKKTWVDETKLTEIEAPFDLTSFILSDEYDVRPAFCTDENLTLKDKWIEFTTIIPSDYWVNLLWVVYFAKQETLKNKSNDIQAFINSVAQWRLSSFENKEQAVSYLKTIDSTINEKKEMEALKIWENKYFNWESWIILFASPERFQDTANAAIDLWMIKSFNYSQQVDLSFVNTFNALR
jgi:ABC-type nitrate/sulfonate/bicarbonate transport system substrate-binding protein